MTRVDNINDTHVRFGGMLTVQASRILLQRTFPGDRHRQHQRVERRMIEAFADQLAGGQQHARCIRWQCIKLRDQCGTLLR